MIKTKGSLWRVGWTIFLLPSADQSVLTLIFCAFPPTPPSLLLLKSQFLRLKMLSITRASYTFLKKQAKSYGHAENRPAGFPFSGLLYLIHLFLWNKSIHSSYYILAFEFKAAFGTSFRNQWHNLFRYLATVDEHMHDSTSTHYELIYRLKSLFQLFRHCLGEEHNC